MAGMMKCEEIYNFFENITWLNSKTSTKEKENHIEKIRGTKLHKVAAKAKTFPYYDMFSWSM